MTYFPNILSTDQLRLRLERERFAAVREDHQTQQKEATFRRFSSIIAELQAAGVDITRDVIAETANCHVSWVNACLNRHPELDSQVRRRRKKSVGE